MDTSTLLWGVLFGALGLGYFVYGKKQQAVVPLLCGLALMVLPYFVYGMWTLLAVGAVLSVLPFIVRY